MANSVDPDQTAPIGAVCSGSTLFASILNSSVMLGNCLQQTTSADDIFGCIFSCALRLKCSFLEVTYCISHDKKFYLFSRYNGSLTSRTIQDGYITKTVTSV